MLSIMTGPKDPEPGAMLIFDAVVIPVKAFLYPPFLLDALRPVRLFNMVNVSFIAEKHRRIIRDRRCYLDQLRRCKRLTGRGRSVRQVQLGCSVSEAAVLIERSGQ